MERMYPDYENCTANFACSILKEFQVEEIPNPTLEAADRLLEKSHENIVVILLDGMGINVLKHNLDPHGFFNRHLAASYQSVFPSTTVAATTSMDSGLFPCQHGWLGWDCYFKELDKNVSVFLNTESATAIPAADYHVVSHFLPYKSVIDRIREAGGQAYRVTPFVWPRPQSFEAICQLVEDVCRQKGKKYVYAYWNEPDGTMHKTGCYSDEARRTVRKLEEQVEKLCSRLTDAQIFITADHGHVDSNGAVISDYPKIMECLVRMPSIEPRALNLFVKKGWERQLEHEWKKAFGDRFLLLTKEEVRKKQLFGTGKERAYVDGMLGEYLAVAVSDLTIYNTREEKERFIGVHAGLLADEMRVPLIAAER